MDNGDEVAISKGYPRVVLASREFCYLMFTIKAKPPVYSNKSLTASKAGVLLFFFLSHSHTLTHGYTLGIH